MSSLPNPLSQGGGDESASYLKCPHCGAMAPDLASCPDCRWPMTPLPVEQRAAAAAAYLPLLPAAVVLLLPAFRRNRFVRFNAWQSLLLWAASLILAVAALLFSNVAPAIVLLVLGILAVLAMLFLWVVLTVKAFVGDRFELPLLGWVAARLK